MDPKPKQRASLEVVYEDERRETIIVKRLSNTDRNDWLQSGFNWNFLVFRSVERADPNKTHGQEWFDTLQPDSANAIVQQALELNYAPDIKKNLNEARQMVESWLSLISAPSSDPADTTSKD